jgi:hypothetical protein
MLPSAWAGRTARPGVLSSGNQGMRGLALTLDAGIGSTASVAPITTCPALQHIFAGIQRLSERRPPKRRSLPDPPQMRSLPRLPRITSSPPRAMAAFEREVPIPRFSAPRSWIAGGRAPWAEMGGAVKPRTRATAPSARRREGRKRVALKVLIMHPSRYAQFV